MSEAVQPPLVQKLAAEGLGTFVLVFFGVGTALVSDGNYVATGLAFGLAVLVMAYAVGRISGGHFNPAVSVGAALAGRIAWRDVATYVGAQLGGALLAGLALFTLMHGFEGFKAEGNMGQNSFGDDGTGYAVWAALLLEIILTAVFLYVILSVTDARNTAGLTAAPVAIGLALTLIHFASMGLTGTSVNPARSIGVGVFAGGDAVLQLWLFILAPLLGAAIAGITYPLVFGRDAEPVPGSGFTLPVKPAAGGAAWGATTTTSEYPGWKWDAASQQWVADTQTAATPAAGETATASTGAAAAQTEYPGWKWDADAQQWVADPSTAEGDATQIRPSDS